MKNLPLCARYEQRSNYSPFSFLTIFLCENEKDWLRNIFQGIQKSLIKKLSHAVFSRTELSSKGREEAKPCLPTYCMIIATNLLCSEEATSSKSVGTRKWEHPNLYGSKIALYLRRTRSNYTHEHFLLPRFLYFCCWFLILQNHHRIKLIIIRSQPKERKDNTIQHSTASWRTNPSPPPLTTTLGNRRKDINQYGLYLPSSFFSD